MIIAVDFDGTIVEHEYPAIGDEVPFAIDTMKHLIADGHQLILWTYRAGEELEEAVDYCKKRGITFYAINKNFPEEVYSDKISRKIIADMYIDDRNFGGLPDWGVVYSEISGKQMQDPPKKSLLSRLFSSKKK